MTETGVLFVGLNAVIAALVGVLAFAVMKFIVAARAMGKEPVVGSETAFMAAAMEQAVQRLREQERAMKERAEASERLSEEIIASITSGLLVVTSERTVRILNPAGRRIMGIADVSAGVSLDQVLRSAAPLAAVIEECLSAGRPVLRRSVQVRHPSGAAIHLGVTVSPIQDADARAHGAICLFTDLSAVVDLEEQLRLKDSLARLGELTAGIAHEFRNGLATIHGYGRLLDLERLPEDFRPFVIGIREETEALRQVVANFLNFAKPAELALGPVALRAIADRAAEEIRAEARARGGDVHVSGDFEVVLGDEVLLRQAFSNLCRNALEACAETGVAPQIDIEGSLDRVQRSQVMTVTDNGPGVNANVTARMFRPFFTTKKSGTGLGLALVQKIIVTHNGRVTAANADSGGARITVTLPLRSE
ncbi:MAG TPA: ATP-binding protein [Vicinamibacterales bacterium]|jgi:PAS domain S-box-containing protein|nr:ATP-binding protein [Vicinamibacterales bacterium]